MTPHRGHRPSAVTVHTFRDDQMFPRIERVVAAILAKETVVTPIDVLIGMGMLTPDRLADWRFGRVPYLERVINCNLTRLSRILRILRFHVHDLNLVPSMTVYVRHGKGPKQRLRFTKTGDAGLEKAYATHYVWPGKGLFHLVSAKAIPDAKGAQLPEKASHSARFNAASTRPRSTS